MRNTKAKKAGNERGMVAEFIKHSGSEMLKLIADLFNDILHPKGKMLTAWRQNRIKVLFKDVDRDKPENYRPICLTSILYKLFSMVVLHRIGPILENKQSKDQTGFRKSFSMEDDDGIPCAVVGGRDRFSQGFR